MPTRQNPFYQYRNPAIGQAFNGIASIFGGPVDAKTQSMIAENQAQASANNALAGYRGEQTRGERDKNNAMVSNPQALAELLLSGGVLKDDPFKVNPDFNPQPIDWANVLSTPTPTGPITSALLSGATAQDKMAAALQEATIRGLKLDDVLKAAGISEYQRRAFGANPDTALAAGPFVGLNPNTQTALTTGRQDAISARDANEDFVKQQSINDTAIEREGIQQSGANARNQFSVLNAPITAGNNADVVVSPARGKAAGITPDADGRYVVRGRTTVGTGQDQQPGSLGGEAVAGRDRPAPGKGGTGKTLRFEAPQIKAVNSMIESGGAKIGATMPLATRDLIRDNAAKYYRDPASPEYGDLANATARSMREMWGDPSQGSTGFFGTGKVMIPQSVVLSVRKALDAGVDPDTTFKTIAQRTGYTRKQIEAVLNAQQPAR